MWELLGTLPSAIVYVNTYNTVWVCVREIHTATVFCRNDSDLLLLIIIDFVSTVPSAVWDFKTD